MSLDWPGPLSFTFSPEFYAWSSRNSYFLGVPITVPQNGCSQPQALSLFSTPPHSSILFSSSTSRLLSWTFLSISLPCFSLYIEPLRFHFSTNPASCAHLSLASFGFLSFFSQKPCLICLPFLLIVFIRTILPILKIIRPRCLSRWVSRPWADFGVIQKQFGFSSRFRRSSSPFRRARYWFFLLIGRSKSMDEQIRSEKKKAMRKTADELEDKTIAW